MSVTGEPGRRPGQVRRAGLATSRPGCSARSASSARWPPASARGEGQRIDTSLWEGALALSIWETAELWSTGRAPQPLGSAHRLTAPYQALRTRDGHITVGGNNQKLWERLCAAIGREDLPADPRFATNADRMANRPELAAELESALAAHDTATGSTRCSTRASPPARSSTTRRSSPTRTRSRVRWWWRWSTPRRAPCTGSASR